MSFIASRLGSGVGAVLVAAGLTLSSTTVEAAAPRAAPHAVAYAVPGWCGARPYCRPEPKPTRPVALASGLVAQELALVNADRRAAGLPALAESAALDRIATARAQDMAANGYFSHYRPGHSTLAVLELLRANGVSFSWYGENIIWESGQPAASIAAHFNTWWMNSPEHRANILNTHYAHIGIGVVTSGSRVYMVEDFTN